MRAALRAGAAFILFVTIVSAWGFWEEEDGDEDAAAAAAEASGEIAGAVFSRAGLGPSQIIRFSSDLAALSTARTDAEAQAAADRFATRLRESGVADSVLARIGSELWAVAEHDDTPLAAALRRAFGAEDVAATPVADSLARAYASALAAADSAAAPAVRPRRALERLGGYTAGLFTGLLGFAQVFWDRNRQGIQDKIAETVVIRVASRVPAAQQPRGGTQSAAHGAFHGGCDEVVARQG